jgi:hypothetical protein
MKTILIPLKQIASTYLYGPLLDYETQLEVLNGELSQRSRILEFRNVALSLAAQSSKLADIFKHS